MNRTTESAFELETMTTELDDIRTQLAQLERSLQRSRRLTAVCGVALAGVVLSGFVRGPETSEELRTKRLIVVDAKGRPRIELGQDKSDFRMSQSAGLTLYDSTGAERGGFGTMASGRVVLGLDAPVGVGSPMRDRVGIVVDADGSAHVMLIDNETRAVAKLQSDGKGGGGVQVYQWEPDSLRIRTVTYDGDRREAYKRRRE